MTSQFPAWGAGVFLVFFALMWLAIGVLLGLFSGWYGLRARFPDRPQTAVFKLNHLYATLGSVHFNGILMLDVCPGGLRLRMWRIFMPFAGNIFVPWSQLRVTRRNRILWKVAIFDFGGRGARLKIAGHLANRLARAAGSHWPERGVFPPETAAQAALRIGGQWLAATLVVGAFFSLVPWLTAGEPDTRSFRFGWLSDFRRRSTGFIACSASSPAPAAEASASHIIN